MKCQILFSRKNKKISPNCRLLNLPIALLKCQETLAELGPIDPIRKYLILYETQLYHNQTNKIYISI